VDRLPLVVVAGPTAVGKTRIAVALAHRVDGEIVCADSRTLYRGMDIGTAKPSPEDRAAVPHHLLDVADPDQTVTLAEYQRLALGAIAAIRTRGRTPLLVGGTGLYLRAVVDRVAVPPVPPDWALRAKLEAEERAGGPGTLHRRLHEVDPATAARIHPRNVRRIIRALEVHARTGTPISVLQDSVSDGRWVVPDPPAGAPADTAPGIPVGAAPGAAPAVRMVALTLDRARLYERIDRRVATQLTQRFVDEVRDLLRAGYARTLPAMQGLGYKEIAAYLEGEATLADAIARLRQHTRRYVKRQWTWLRADARYRWVDVADDPPGRVAERVHAVLCGAGAPSIL